MRTIPAAANSQFGVFTTGQALEMGWSRAALNHAVGAGRIVNVRRGIYAVTPTELPSADNSRFELAQSFRAESVMAVLATSRSVASHFSAAVLHGLPVIGGLERACVTVPPGVTGDATGVHLHRATLASADLDPKHALMRTSVPRTVIDIAREHGIEAAVVAGDNALHRRLTSRQELQLCLERCRTWPMIQRAEAAVERLDGSAESPLESLSRLRLRELGLPEPRLQVQIFDTTGVFLGRTDFYWREAGVVGEADGQLKYEDSPHALREEKLRQERLEQAGLIVVRWGWSQLDRPDEFRARISDALERGRRRHPADRNWRVAKA